MLIRHQDITRSRRLLDLAQQQVRLGHPAPRGKRPERAHAFAAHVLGFGDAGIRVAAGRDQSPQPGERRGQNVQQAQDAVIGLLTRTGWGPDPKTADVHGNRIVDHARHQSPRHDHARIGHGLPGSSCVCSQMSAVAPGLPSMLSINSGSAG